MLSSGGGLAYSVKDEFVKEEDESVSLQFVCALQREQRSGTLLLNWHK